MLDATFRPLTTWPGERAKGRSRSQFSASWSATLDLLDRELRHLRAKHVVVEIDLAEDDIRLDGWPRSGARPRDPGIVVSFDSKFGPLRYASDAFTDWQANLRAIALGLEALRKVDRYGITKRGEQYTGWKALPPGQQSLNGTMSREEAAVVLANAAGADPRMMFDQEHRRAAYKLAAKKLHPDAGGNHESFALLNRAKEMLDAST